MVYLHVMEAKGLPELLRKDAYLPGNCCLNSNCFTHSKERGGSGITSSVIAFGSNMDILPSEQDL